MLEVSILAIGLLISISTGLFVLTRNHRHIVNRIYGLLALSLSVFPIANYLSLRTADRLFYIRTVIFFTTLAITSLYFLVVYMHVEKGKPPLTLGMKLGIYFTALVAVLCYTPFVFSDLSNGENPVPIPAPGSILFLGHILIFLTAGFTLLIKRVRNNRGKQRQQFLLMLVGISPMFLLSPITGFVMPVVFQNTSLVFLSPIYGTIFVGMIGYAIVRHRLFDIRFVVARSLAYIFSLLGIASLYGFMAFFIVSRNLLASSSSETTQQVIYTVLAVSLAFAFQPLKKFFDKVTNRVFYRDAYDPQVLLDELNKVVVTNVDIRLLLERSSAVLEKYLKAEYCAFGIKETTYVSRRVIGHFGHGFDEADANDKVRKIVSSFRKKIIVVDEITDDFSVQQSALREFDIAVLVRLNSSASFKDEGLGYMVLGTKKSGNPYNKQDLNIIEIIANELVIAIQNALSFEEIEKFNVTLQQKIDDSTKELRKTNEKLKALDEAKDEFISMASHQLRTPLTSVKGYVSMVLEGDAGAINDMQRKLLEQSFVSSQRMVYLIADLLNVSRLRTGKFIIEAKRTNLADVIAGEVQQLVETAKGRELDLIFNPPAKFPDLMLDETKIRQVIMNFIDNAIYYTPAGGKITVSLLEKPQSVEMTVTDTGMGVPKSEQHHLFTKFYRAGNAKKARPDGTGLGLFMAKKVIVAQGGAIIFHSEEGKGSTFGFTFPKAKLSPPAGTNSTASRVMLKSSSVKQ